MPSVSDKQRRFMAAAAHDPKFAKRNHIPMTVAQEFNQADKGKKLAEAMKRMPKDGEA
jgi:ribosome assembly protein YihI (activator of Der GTPase)